MRPWPRASLHVLQQLSPRTAVSRASCSTLSPTHKGTAFEHRSLDLLQKHLSMSLRRVGGKDDGGIDLLGWWWLPSSNVASVSAEKTFPSHDGADDAHRRRFRVIAQCKDEKRKTSPKYVRELEGVLYRYVAGTHAHAPTHAQPVLDTASALSTGLSHAFIHESHDSARTLVSDAAHALAYPTPHDSPRCHRKHLR